MSTISAASKKQLLSTARLLEKFAKKDMPGYEPLNKKKKRSAPKRKATGGSSKKKSSSKKRTSKKK